MRRRNALYEGRNRTQVGVVGRDAISLPDSRLLVDAAIAQPR